MLNNYSCRSPLESSSVFGNSGENFKVEGLTNSMMLGYNFTENFTADIAMGVFRNVYSCFSWQIYGSITIKSNGFAGIKYRPSDFLKKQREYILA